MPIRNFGERDLKAIARCLVREKLDRKRKFQVETRASWLGEALKNRELKVKVATEAKKIVGFAEYLPIQHAPAPITGRDLYYVNCVHVNDGNANGLEVGKALVKEMEEDVRSEQVAGMTAIAYDYELDFASVSFYRTVGYREVVRGGTSVVMWKKFRNGSGPRFMPSSYDYQPQPGKVVVDAFWSSACLRSIADIYNIRKACKPFKSKVALNEYNAADPEDRNFSGGIIRALCVNGRWLPVSTLPEVTEERVVETIEKALAEMESTSETQ